MTTTVTVPLTIGEDGVIRIGKTRVTLDTVVYAFQDGATAEEIASQYPSLDLRVTSFHSNVSTAFQMGC